MLQQGGVQKRAGQAGWQRDMLLSSADDQRNCYCNAWVAVRCVAEKTSSLAQFSYLAGVDIPNKQIMSLSPNRQWRYICLGFGPATLSD